MSEFLNIEDADDYEGLGRYLELRFMSRQDVGKVLATFRAWPGPLFWVLFGLLWALIGVAMATAPNWEEAAIRGSILATNLAFWGGLILTIYGLDRHRVCEHGLVVGFKKNSRYVIPWATIDPGRIRVARRISLLVRRPEVLQTSACVRLGVISFAGIVVNGLDEPARPWNPSDKRAGGSPFAWWLLATRRAPELLAAIEQAMIADGYPAHGLATRAQEQAFTVNWKPAPQSPIPPRLGTDPVIGVDGPLMG